MSSLSQKLSKLFNINLITIVLIITFFVLSSCPIKLLQNMNVLFILYCIVLYCIVLYCIIMYCEGDECIYYQFTRNNTLIPLILIDQRNVKNFAIYGNIRSMYWSALSQPNPNSNSSWLSQPRKLLISFSLKYNVDIIQTADIRQADSINNNTMVSLVELFLFSLAQT